MSEIQVEKRLKNPSFSPADTAVALASYVGIYYILSLLFLRMGQGLAVSIICSLLLEGSFVGAVLLASAFGKVEFVSATKLSKKPSYKTFLIAAAIAVITLLAFSSLTNVFMVAIEKLGYNPSDDITIPNVGYYFLYVIAMCIVPAFMEDIMFRGCVLNGLCQINKHFAVIASALLFALMHGSPDQTVHQLILGIVLGYVVVYSSSIWPAIMIHFLNNFMALTIGFIQGPSQPVDVSTISWAEVGKSFSVALALAAAGAALVVLCIWGIKKTEGKPQPKKENNAAEQANVAEEKKAKPESRLALTVILYVLAVGFMLLEWILRLLA